MSPLLGSAATTLVSHRQLVIEALPGVYPVRLVFTVRVDSWVDRSPETVTVTVEPDGVPTDTLPAETEYAQVHSGL